MNSLTSSAVRSLLLALEPAQLSAADCLLTACSGGSDSMALIELLRRAWPQGMGPELVLAHYNHKLRPDSDQDAAFVQDYAQRHKLTFLLGEAGAHEIGSGSETEARDNRYSWFEECRAQLSHAVKGAVWLLTAHQRDDQAETVLINLCRGSGLKGLGGMQTLDHERLLSRPLLTFSRSELRGILQETGQSWVDDPSNERDETWRNQLRHKIMPQLDEIFARDTTLVIARAAELLARDEHCLSKLASEAGLAISHSIYGFAPESEGRAATLLYKLIDAEALLALDSALSSRIIRGWWSELSGAWPRDLAAEDEILFRSALQQQSAADLAAGLRLSPSKQPLSSAGSSFRWRLWRKETVDGFHGYIDDAQQGMYLQSPANCSTEAIHLGSDQTWRYFDVTWTKKLPELLRCRRQNDRLTFSNEGRIWHKKLTDWQAEQGIWPELRDRMGLLAVGDRVIGIPAAVNRPPQPANS